jgi:UDP-glucose 4-epimerase
MNILVTGGAGFIGSHLVRKLLSMGHDVLVVDDLRGGLRTNVPEGARFVCLDINSPSLLDIMDRGRFQAVVHLAAQTRVDVSIKDPYGDTRDNIMGTVNVLECARKTGVQRVVFASSAAVYGDPPETDLPLSEDYRLSPLSFYGLSKATIESYLRLYHKWYGLDYVILRFANVYGERAEVGGEGGVVNVFAKRAACDLDITVYGDGSQSRDYIYVGDIANGIVCALTTEHADEVYHLSTGREASLLDVLAELRRASGKELTPNFARTRSGDIYRSVLSNEKARRFLGWEPYMKLKDGIILTYQYAAGQGGR